MSPRLPFSRRHPRSLFRQIYLHGLALLVLVALALVAAGVFLGRDPRWRTSPARLAHHAGSFLATSPEGELPTVTARLAEELDVSLAVYGEDGRLLAAAGPRPPVAEPAPTFAPPRAHFRRFGSTAAAGHGRTLRLVLNTTESDWLLRIGGTLVLVVVVVALVSAPLARGIARPIERLADAARRLGEGDLRARSGLRGRGEIGALGRTFDEMAERLQRLLTAQRQLLADVSHELRTPLARMRVSIALAADAPADELRRHARALEEDVIELEALVGDLLTASRLDSGGELVLRREPVDLRSLAGLAKERLARLHPGRHVDLACEGVPPVSGEPALLARVLDNLLDNAARYSEGPIGLSVSTHEEGVQVAVRDEGPGIAPEDQAQLFTPFFRTDLSRNRHTGGAGLGLFLCKRIIEAHGGTVAVDSRPGAGTTVRLWLPASPKA